MGRRMSNVTACSNDGVAKCLGCLGIRKKVHLGVTLGWLGVFS